MAADLQAMVQKWRELAASHESKACDPANTPGNANWLAGMSEMAGDCADELEAALRAEAGAVGDGERIDWLAEQFKTCTVYMSGQHPYSPGHKVRDMRGSNFRDAIDNAMGRPRPSQKE